MKERTLIVDVLQPPRRRRTTNDPYPPRDFDIANIRCNFDKAQRYGGAEVIDNRWIRLSSILMTKTIVGGRASGFGHTQRQVVLLQDQEAFSRMLLATSLESDLESRNGERGNNTFLMGFGWLCSMN